MSLFAVGDIHGCAATLDVLLDRLALTEDDTLVFVGDYIDRGPDSKGVIDRLLALQETHDCVFLRGNHEALMLDYVTGRGPSSQALRFWQQNGGEATLQSYAAGQTARIPDAHLAFLRQTKLYHETPDFFFVHAGLDPHRTVRENVEEGKEETFLWQRSHLEASEWAWEKPVVCGHTPHQEPIDRDQLILIDTGCVYHRRPGLGHLTAVRLPERAFVSVAYEG